MKYVIFEKPDGLETVRIFDEITDHAHVVQEVLNLLPGLKILSAGKYRHFGALGGQCFNGSVGLGIKFDMARSTADTDLVRQFLNFEA
jgi:hypothetical protein